MVRVDPGLTAESVQNSASNGCGLNRNGSTPLQTSREGTGFVSCHRKSQGLTDFVCCMRALGVIFSSCLGYRRGIKVRTAFGGEQPVFASISFR